MLLTLASSNDIKDTVPLVTKNRLHFGVKTAVQYITTDSVLIILSLIITNIIYIYIYIYIYIKQN